MRCLCYQNATYYHYPSDIVDDVGAGRRRIMIAGVFDLDGHNLGTILMKIIPYPNLRFNTIRSKILAIHKIRDFIASEFTLFNPSSAFLARLWFLPLREHFIPSTELFCLKPTSKKNNAAGKCGYLCPNLPDSSISPPKNDIDSRRCFRYLDYCWLS